MCVCARAPQPHYAHCHSRAYSCALPVQKILFFSLSLFHTASINLFFLHSILLQVCLNYIKSSNDLMIRVPIYATLWYTFLHFCNYGISVRSAITVRSDGDNVECRFKWKKEQTSIKKLLRGCFIHTSNSMRSDCAKYYIVMKSTHFSYSKMKSYRANAFVTASLKWLIKTWLL